MLGNIIHMGKKVTTDFKDRAVGGSGREPRAKILENERSNFEQGAQ